jgi:hypothetical protein
MNNTNLTQQVIEDNADFLIGDAVVLNEVIGNFDEIYNVVEVYENTVDVYRYWHLNPKQKVCS